MHALLFASEVKPCGNNWIASCKLPKCEVWFGWQAEALSDVGQWGGTRWQQPNCQVRHDQAMLALLLATVIETACNYQI